MIGTSTNLVVHGLLSSVPGGRSLALMELGWVGVPCAIVGILWCVLMGSRLLPDRQGAITVDSDPREYTVDMQVPMGSPLIRQSIEAAGLRHLPGLYLAEIERDGRVMPAVGPQELLEEGDRLVFVGVVDSVKDLQKIRGLVPADEEVAQLATPRSERCLIEAVVSDTSPVVGCSVRESRFRSLYNAVVIAVARNGQRILGTKIGDIVLRAGDTLLLEAHPGFADQHRHSRIFYLVSAVQDSAPPRHERAPAALAILLGAVGLASFEVMGMLQAALLGSVAMILSGCCTASEARRTVDLSVLTVIAGSFAIGKAIESTGLAGLIADLVTGSFASTPHAALIAIYALTMIFNAVISNNAAVALLFPIAVATAQRLDVDLLPFGVALMMAGSNDFATPIGYQTNLMVYGPGGYRFLDYVRFGGPLNLLMMAVAVLLIPIIWPF
jgi:di/tricarboxylate transporter